MLCVAKVLLHAAKVLLYAAKVLLCNAKVLLYATGAGEDHDGSVAVLSKALRCRSSPPEKHEATSHPFSSSVTLPTVSGNITSPSVLPTRSPFSTEIPSYPKPLPFPLFCSFVLFSFRPSVLFSFCSFLLFSFCSFVLLSLPPFQIHNWYTTITPVVRFAHTHV